MKLTTVLTVSAAAITLSTFIPSADAKAVFVQRLPNGANVPGIKALGHMDGTGQDDSENSFGKAFDRAGQSWTVALCQDDADGDGQTNGQELGDPCCEWTKGGTPRYTTASHPGDANKKNDPTLWASITCPPIIPSTASRIATATAALALGIAATLVAI